MGLPKLGRKWVPHERRTHAQRSSWKRKNRQDASNDTYIPDDLVDLVDIVEWYEWYEWHYAQDVDEEKVSVEKRRAISERKWCFDKVKSFIIKVGADPVCEWDRH